MIYLILLGILFFTQLLAASWCDLAQKTADEKKALKHKMICSGICLASALLCSAINGDFSDTYPILFISALLLHFLNNIIEEKKGKIADFFTRLSPCFTYSLISTALWLRCNEMFEIYIYSTKADGIALLVTWIICFIFCILLRKEKASFIPAVFLLVRALVFGIPLQLTNAPQMQAASCAIILGALALAVSSALSAFDKKGQKSLLRINLHYFGLMFISCSVAVL